MGLDANKPGWKRCSCKRFQSIRITSAVREFQGQDSNQVKWPISYYNLTCRAGRVAEQEKLQINSPPIADERAIHFYRLGNCLRGEICSSCQARGRRANCLIEWQAHCKSTASNNKGKQVGENEN
jgi:hypothetical protein